MTKLNMFLTELYKPLLVDQNLQEGNYIKLEKYTTEGLKVQEYHKNINDLINSAKNNSLYYNTFYSLATNNGMSKSNKDSIYKTCLAWDFDKKDYDSLTIKDILHKFREIGLYYNAIVDSGHGYHVYKFIEPTKDIELANKVSKHIAKLVGADENFTGQVLRVPTTHNIKDPKKIKLVNIVFLDTEIKRKNIETLAKKYIMACNENKNITYEMNKGQVPKCIETILTTGSPKGHRNDDLKKIVISLRNANKTIAQIKALAKEWNELNVPSMSLKELEYQVNYMYDNLKSIELNCKDCKSSKECYATVFSQFEHEHEEVIPYSENMCKKSKRNKKGVSKMNGNQLLVIGILKTHCDGLTQEQLLDKLHYTNEKYKIENVAMSKPTLVKTLKALEENKYISYEVINRKRVYTLIKERVKEESKFLINYGVIRECVKGFITPSELELYCFMRYLHNEQHRLGLAKHKGNLFQITQEELAVKMGIQRERVTVMINNLLEEEIISIWHRGKIENSPCWYNVYRLNY